MGRGVGGMTSLVACLVLSLCSVCVYHNSLDNEFVFDDHLAIVNNADTDPSTSYLDLWKHDIWGKDLTAHDSHRSYRPLLIVAFKILRHNFGLNPRPIRIASVICHAISSILVYFLGLQVLSNWHVSFASAILFSLHPVHVESVAAVVNIAEPLSCIFFSAGLLMYMSNIQETDEYEGEATEKKTTKNSSASDVHCFWYYLKTILQMVFWTFFLVLSILFKETGITVLGVVFGLSVLKMLAAVLSKLVSFKQNSSHISFSNHFGWLLFSIVMLVGYFVFRALIVSTETDITEDIDSMSDKCGTNDAFSLNIVVSKVLAFFKTMQNSVNMLCHLLLTPLLSLKGVVLGVDNATENLTSAADVSSFYLDDSALIRKAENPFAFLQGQEKVLSLMYLHFRYFFLMVWPVDLSPEYAFNCIPSVATIEDDGNYRAVLAMVMYVCIVLAAFYGLYSMVFKKKYLQSKKNEEGYLSDHALLLSVILMVVPFVPAAGVFLRLGTLLAERLLYVPSIGFCYLLSIFLFQTSRVICRTFLLPHHVRKMSASMFWGLVFPICVFYSLRTHYRNIDWKTDTDLFLASLDVCPNSAKLNLQVTKLYLNRGDFEDAARHIAATKSIDPEFCDVWYQEALMNVLYYNNMDEAVSKLSDSLSCVFTSSGAFTLLQNIWTQEIQKSPKDFKIYERIANIGFKAEMYSIAVQYYQQGAVMATEQLKYSDALNLSKKTEKAVKKFYSQTHADHKDNIRGALSYAYREMSCNMYGLGGLLRSRLHEDMYANEFDTVAKKKNFSKTVLKQILLRDQYLNKALQPYCVYEISDTREIFYSPVNVKGVTLSNYALTVLNMHISNLSGKIQKMKQLLKKSAPRNGKVASFETSRLKEKLADECRKLAQVLVQGAKLYAESFKVQMKRYYENVQIIEKRSPSENKKHKKNDIAVQKVLENGMQEAKESRYSSLTTSVRLFLEAGEAYYNGGNYSSAFELFDTVRTFNEISKVDLSGEAKKIAYHDEAMAAKDKILDSVLVEEFDVPGIIIPCRAHYWCALSLASGSAGEIPVMYNLTLRGEIRMHLQKLEQCDYSTEGITTEMQAYATSLQEEIRFMVDHVDGDLEDP